MQVSLEVVGDLKRKLMVQVPAQGIEETIENRLKKMAKDAKLPGFRPGKVPVRIMQQRYGASVRQEVLTETVRSSLHQALDEKELQPAAMPAIDLDEVKPGEDLRFTAEFDVYPEIVLPDFSALRVKRPVPEVSEADIDRFVNNACQAKAEFKETSEAAKTGDRLTIRYAWQTDSPAAGATDAGEPETVVDESIVIGEGTADQPGFKQLLSERLAGFVAGDQATFDSPSANEERDAQPTARLWVQVDQVERREVPEPTDAFAQSVGVEDLAGLRELGRREIHSHLEQKADDQLRQALSKAILDGIEIPLPQTLVEAELERMKQQFQQHLGVDAHAQLPQDVLEEAAHHNVAWGLVTAEIAREQAMQVDNNRLREKILEYARNHADPQSFLQQVQGDQEALSGLRTMVLEDQVLDWLQSQVQLEDEPLTFEALLNENNRG